MPQPYTDQEVEAAVERIVRSSIRRPVGTLGARDTGTTFNDFQEQTTAVLTTTPSAPFYVVKLGCGRLIDKVRALSDVCANINEAAVALARPVRPVDSIASLSNARVAAEALALAGTGRSSQFLDIQKLPAFQRLDRNIQSFLDDYSAPNLRRGGQLVRSPQEGRQLLPGYIRDLKDQRANLIDLVEALAGAISDYEALDLPHLLAGGIVSRASQVIADREQQLAALSANDRVAVLRDATLDLIAARSLIRRFSSLSSPTAFLISNGNGGVYADQDHPAVPAVLTVPLHGPYATRVDSTLISNQLDFLIDGTFRIVVSVSGSFVAQLTGILPEPYNIQSSGPQQNNLFDLYFVESGVSNYIPVTLTSGVTRTAQQICNDINGAIAGSYPIEAVAAATPKKFEGKVDIAGAGPYTFTLTNPYASWVSMSVQVGDKIQVTEGANLLSTFTVTVVSPSVLTATQVTGPPVTPETNKLIIVGLYFAVKLKIVDSYVATALTNRSGIQIGTVGVTIQSRTNATLGFPSGVTVTSDPMLTGTAVDLINSSTLTAKAGVSRLKASVTTVPVLANQLVHTDPARPTVAFVYRYRGIGDITIGGLAATLVLPGLVDTVVVGDEIVIRATTVPADQNQRGVVTGVSGTTVTATFTSSLTVTTGVTVDIAPDLTGLVADTVLIVADGPNRGTYRVNSQGSIVKSELTLNRGFQAPQDFSGQPSLLVADISYEYLTVASTKTDLTTAMQLDDGSPVNSSSAAYLFAPTRPISAVGSTPWFRLDDMPKDIEVGDIIELHLTGYNVIDHAVSVTSIDGQVLGIDPPLPTTTPSVPFEVTAQFPFGRIRRVRRDNFNVFETDARRWLARPQLQDHWLGELDRLVTTALSEPTPVSVNDLRRFINGLAGILTIAEATALSMSTTDTIESIALEYHADVVSEVDTLVQSLLQQGADRAVDILLEGRFSQYFGFTADQMSYAGNVLGLTKQVMQQDLPVRAVRRGELRQRQVSLGSYEDTDYEYDQSDIDTGLVPDAPGGNPPPRQGDAY